MSDSYDIQRMLNCQAKKIKNKIPKVSQNWPWTRHPVILSACVVASADPETPQLQPRWPRLLNYVTLTSPRELADASASPLSLGRYRDQSDLHSVTKPPPQTLTSQSSGNPCTLH